MKDIELMGKKLYPTSTLTQARRIVSLWDHIGTAPILGPQGYENLRTDLETVQELKEKISRLEKQLLSLRNERDTTCLEIWQQVKRARAGVRSVYGDDSTEYQLSGGTRLSDRKRPRRKVVFTAESPS
jgi:hypothetical protein